MHIGIVAPILTSNIAYLLSDKTNIDQLPIGTGGAPLIATLIEELIILGHQVTAFTLSNDLSFSQRNVKVYGPNLTVIFIPMRPKAWPFNGWRPGRILDLFGFERRRLVQAIRNESPEVVHAHWVYEYAWAAIDTCLPHVITSHDSPVLIAKLYKGSGFKHSAYRWLRMCMGRYVLKRASFVTTVSPHLISEIETLTPVPVKMIPNPISPKVFSYRRVESQVITKIIMVANGWDAIKNPQVALMAFSLLVEKIPSVELHLYGKEYGSNETANKWWISNQLKGRIFFHGLAPYSDILTAMANSDILLHTSVEESFGAVLAEAMAIGLPIVAGKNSGAVPWVVGDCGILVDVKSPNEVAQALFTLVSQPDLVNKLGAAGNRSVKERFGANIVAHQYQDQYQLALNYR